MRRFESGPAAAVSIMYRRGEGQMSATAEELHEMREEGVRIDAQGKLEREDAQKELRANEN